jgi:predicted HAD superfamily Cof-like phosphohydrolase
MYTMNQYKTNFRKVREFMESFGQEVKASPEFPSDEIVSLRTSLIEEELNELKEAVQQKDIVEVADALTDLLYVVYGAGLAYGIDLDDCFREVHVSNMSKLGPDGKPIYREDGKVMKSDQYKPPKLRPILFDSI